MGKGEVTRNSILHRAVGLASQFGLEGLSIGSLANELALSKSGLFAHFRSKETLQKQVLDAAAEEFARQVVRPAVTEPRGERRNRALFENWLAWAQGALSSRHLKAPPAEPALRRGCIFVAASIELDDRPGPVRDHLVKLQKDWQAVRVRVARTGVETGDFRADLDCEQFAHDTFGVMLAYHHAARLFHDPRAVDRARDAFERLLKGARP